VYENAKNDCDNNLQGILESLLKNTTPKLLIYIYHFPRYVHTLELAGPEKE
jgi:hypothetical protein